MANLKFNDSASIEKEINQLKNYFDIGNMTFSQENRLFKGISNLQSSCYLVAKLQSQANDVKKKRRQLSTQLTSKNKEIDAVQEQITTIEKTLDALRETGKNLKQI